MPIKLDSCSCQSIHTEQFFFQLRQIKVTFFLYKSTFIKSKIFTLRYMPQYLPTDRRNFLLLIDIPIVISNLIQKLYMKLS